MAPRLGWPEAGLEISISNFREELLFWGEWYAWQDSNLRPFASEANALSI